MSEVTIIIITCCLGNGSQFLTLSVSIIVMALLGMFNVHRHHSMNSTAILLYAFTSCISGYVSASLFKRIGGHNWVWNVVLTSSFFALPFFCVWSCVNTVAWIYQSTQALPFTTIVLIMCIWLIGEATLTIPGPLPFIASVLICSWVPPNYTWWDIWQEHCKWV